MRSVATVAEVDNLMPSPLSKIKAMVVVFDQGNTLLMDPFLPVMELQKECFRQAFRDYGIQLSASRICDEWTRSNKEIDYPYIGHFYQEEPIVQHALRKLGVPEDIAAMLALELLRQYRIGLKKVISSNPMTQEVRDTLQKLRVRGKKIGVFSNDRMVGLGLILRVMRVKSFFQYVETSESVGIEKPDPRIFEHILTHFQVRPDLAVYVGDDPVKDIEAAKKSGLKAIQYKVPTDTYNEWWRDYSKRPEYEPDATIDRFSELLDVLE